MTDKYKITFGDLQIGDIAKYYLQKAIDKNWVTEGDNVREFENKFAEKFGYKHSIMTSSGTDADICACASLLEFGANRLDEIITPALSFVATANSILSAGFIPRFVDISLDSENFLNIDPNKIEDAITSKTKAIMVVHTMGKPGKMDEILKIAEDNDLFVIEDACEAHGAKYKGKNVGTIGDIGTFSFYTAHQIVTSEGGMVVTDDDDIADIIRSVKSHGRPPGSIYFSFERVGFNSKATEMTSALGLEGLNLFDENFNKRKENLYKLLELTKDLSDQFYFIKEEKHEILSPHAFPLVIKNESEINRNKLYTYLEDNGIQCKTLFGSLATQHRAFDFLKYKQGDFPVAEYVGKNGIHFGCHQFLTDEDLIYINNILRKGIIDQLQN